MQERKKEIKKGGGVKERGSERRGRTRRKEEDEGTKRDGAGADW